MITILVRPRAPLIVRDGRPFTSAPGARARSLAWPMPSTVAGLLRSEVGHSLRFDWHGDGPDRARALAVQGPLLAVRRGQEGWQPHFAPPRDAHISDAGCLPLLPWSGLDAGAGCDLPTGLVPLRIPSQDKVKQQDGFWRAGTLHTWLLGQAVAAETTTTAHLQRESRVHVGIEHANRTSKEGALFSTDGLAFADEQQGEDGTAGAQALLCRIGADAADLPANPWLTSFGGERRLAEVVPADDALWPACPPALHAALIGQRALRLYLATPAIFAAGWRPGWLDAATLTGSLPTVPSVRVRLVAAAIGRAEAVSGWDYAANRPKAARACVPAGSVFFCEVQDGPLTADQVDSLWCAACSDHEQDRRDGFGLLLPGVWSPAQ